MNETNTFGWRMKKSWFTLLAFVPVIQFIPFFIMNGKVPKKKWVIMGFANILLIVLSIALFWIAPIYQENRMYNMPSLDYPQEPKGRPSFPKGQPNILKYDFDVYDPNYMNTEAYKQYAEDMEAFEQTEEFKEYEKAVEEFESTEEYQKYLDECDEFAKSPEYLEYSNMYEGAYTSGNALKRAAWAVGITTTLLFAVLCFFVERYIFLRNLSVNENRSAVYGQLTGRMDMAPSQGAMQGQGMTFVQGTSQNAIPMQNPNDVTAQFISSLQPNGQNAYAQSNSNVQSTYTQVNAYGMPGPDATQYNAYAAQPQQYAGYEPQYTGYEALPQQSGAYAMPAPETGIQQAEGGQATPINVNTASEEELMTLPGMKTIDAKRIIGYRTANGAFNSTDEFFASFEAKPHMIVKMQDRITLYSVATAGAGAVSNEPHPQMTVKRFDL